MLHSNGLASDGAIRDVKEWPEDVLVRKAKEINVGILDEAFAIALDKEDKLSSLRSQFVIPKMKNVPSIDLNLIQADEDCVYFMGGSMGLKPKAADEYMAKPLEDWGKWAAFNYFVGKPPATECDGLGREITAQILGCNRNEVVLMNGLSVNIHVLLVPFYQPVANRHKVLVEHLAFPSDLYAIRSQIELHGYDPDESLVMIPPREGEATLRTEDIINYIEKYGDTIALIFFSGVHYYTGQYFAMADITAAGHRKGCMVGFDLAHAVGNVKLELHKWQVDCATWCSYKFLNSGAGGIAGIFVHENHDKRKLRKLSGWWGNRKETRFHYNEDFDEAMGAEGYKLSNVPPWLVALNMASLNIFEQTSMDELVEKQFLLTGYLELLINRIWSSNNKDTVHRNGFSVQQNQPGQQLSIGIVTPADPKQRGNQLSLFVGDHVQNIHKELQKRGIACDVRLPGILRLAPAPLYNSFQDMYKFVQTLKTAICIVCSNKSPMDTTS